jgi:hypothetical protein
MKGKKEIQEIIASCQKKLHRALKLAKGHERQKLGKRFKNATAAGNSGEISRINREIAILKDLDLGRAGSAYLCKTLMKIKAFAESELLRNALKDGVETQGAVMTEEERLAFQNITSGMFNMKCVKEAMGDIVQEMYPTLGLPQPEKPAKAKRERKGKDAAKDTSVSEKRVVIGSSRRERSAEELDLEGIEDKDIGLDNNENEVEIDDETLDKYTALLGKSSDEESFDEEVYKANRISPPSNRLSLSLSPLPSPSLSVSDSEEENMSISRSSSPPRKFSKPSQLLKDPPKASTFLPSLMGGYFSGSESEASDLEDDIPKVVKKNRKGQMARRAIFEKKFGAKANHIQKGLPPVGTPKDDGWDSKRGATDGKSGRGRARSRFEGRAEGKQREARNFRQATGDNMMPIGEKKKRGMGKPDDTGKLHASWEAAKKAKLEQKTATFAGKKVVFD